MVFRQLVAETLGVMCCSVSFPGGTPTDVFGLGRVFVMT